MVFLQPDLKLLIILVCPFTAKMTSDPESTKGHVASVLLKQYEQTLQGE